MKVKANYTQVGDVKKKNNRYALRVVCTSIGWPNLPVSKNVSQRLSTPVPGCRWRGSSLVSVEIVQINQMQTGTMPKK